VKIAILVEGKTEMAFKRHLRTFLEARLLGRMPNLDFVPYDGRIPTKHTLRRVVTNLLTIGVRPAEAVVALTDVYTGTNDFDDAADAKTKMRQWVGPDGRFHPHVAQHDFEAWLLPYWADIQKLAGHDRGAPPSEPENVNHMRPPSFHIKEIFASGKSRDHYSKPRDANRILTGKDLMLAASHCPELKAFLNTLIGLSGGKLL
jgi:Domain of unknown function (DUF4276)